MAIEYFLYIDSDLDPSFLVQTVAAGISNPPPGTHIDPAGTTQPALQVFGGVTHARAREYISQEHSIEGRTTLIFRLDKFRIDAATEHLLQALDITLRIQKGDLVVLYNGETEVLRRKSGHIRANLDFLLWTPRNLATLNLDSSGRDSRHGTGA